MQEILLEQPVIQADEITLKVINDERYKSYIWPAVHSKYNEIRVDLQCNTPLATEVAVS
ncbi:hypothetical protein JQC92_12705 [Shewanella sp. 202IG2-18]|nr:hypothetical protein [Parashewanella hymeniacidonis]